jgi:hypothetical protein
MPPVRPVSGSSGSSGDLTSTVPPVPPVQCEEIDASKYTVFHPTEDEYGSMVKGVPSNKLRKVQKCFERKETGHMVRADNEGRIQQLQTTSRPSNERPMPNFRIGQSVHHFWAPWMCSSSAIPKTMHKKARPKWYSALITGQPVWETGTYGGAEFEGWHYTAHWWNGQRDDCRTPEYALMALPPVALEQGRVHSAGLVSEQSPDPDFYVDFNANRK